jgi:hypothetical protein
VAEITAKRFYYTALQALTTTDIGYRKQPDWLSWVCMQWNILHSDVINRHTLRYEFYLLFLSANLCVYCDHVADNARARNCRYTTVFILLKAHVSYIRATPKFIWNERYKVYYIYISYHAHFFYNALLWGKWLSYSLTLNNFIANKCTSFILFSYVTLQSGRHVSIRADHRLGLLYMNIFWIFIPYI